MLVQGRGLSQAAASATAGRPSGGLQLPQTLCCTLCAEPPGPWCKVHDADIRLPGLGPQRRGGVCDQVTQSWPVLGSAACAAPLEHHTLEPAGRTESRVRQGHLGRLAQHRQPLHRRRSGGPCADILRTGRPATLAHCAWPSMAREAAEPLQATHVVPMRQHPGSFIMMADIWDPTDLGASRCGCAPCTCLAEQRGRPRCYKCEARLAAAAWGASSRVAQHTTLCAQVPVAAAVGHGAGRSCHCCGRGAGAGPWGAALPGADGAAAGAPARHGRGLRCAMAGLLDAAGRGCAADQPLPAALTWSCVWCLTTTGANGLASRARTAALCQRP